MSIVIGTCKSKPPRRHPQITSVNGKHIDQDHDEQLIDAICEAYNGMVVEASMGVLNHILLDYRRLRYCSPELTVSVASSSRCTRRSEEGFIYLTTASLRGVSSANLQVGGT